MKHRSRRTFLSLAGAATAGVALYATTNLLDDEEATAASGPLDGVSQPSATKLTPFKDALRIPPTLRPKRDGTTEIPLVERELRLHSQMPPTPLWTYDGHFPGPTIEVERGRRTRIAWANRLRGTHPVKAVWALPAGAAPGLEPLNGPGSQGAIGRPEVDDLVAYTSVHLHGGHQHATSDGAPDAGVTYGGSQLSEYPNDLAAAHLFYHDHAMPVTALNVMSGLMGHYIVRDEAEERLDLPRGAYEIPLALADVNFDTDSAGRLDGRILAKRVSLGRPVPGELPTAVGFFGPYTMVNGVVWPYLSVQARAYRFRIVNSALSRAYRLVVIDEETGKAVPNAMKLIGTDLGLLGKPQVIEEALTLNPGERADVVVDFAAFAGKRLKLVNTVPGVPAGVPVPPANIPFPDVMQFRVARHAKSPYKAPATLSHDFKRLTTADTPKGAVERFVVVAFDKSRTMPQMWEMQEADGSTKQGDGVVQVKLAGGTKTLRRVGTAFEDTTTFFGSSGAWEKWTFLSLAPAGGPPIVHPMHIHLMNFQVVDRRSVDAASMDFALGGTTKPLELGAALPVAPEESGWKDTFALATNTAVTVLGRYGALSGRFMYHCHILDHEDEGMMRPLVIMPPSVLTMHHMMQSMTMGGMDMSATQTHHATHTRH
ncbi:multicopper oxidase family protein [Streptomyces sp. 4N124]|uniref:multicopper oxidase family protein n=1 Tax=Streptomyces sp. 4N124 TaxID=3457420 RepID=UPI003FD3DCA5